jgi:ATP phosphoribosyltransferase regulatory subunit
MNVAHFSDSAEALMRELAQYFAGEGYLPIEPGMMLPADAVLDHMGESIRKRLLITTAPDGTEFSMRPDFTLPLAHWQIANGPPDGGRYSYSGFAFRYPNPDELTRVSAEFRQVGIENFGAGNAAEADADTLALAVRALQRAGIGSPKLILGDVGLFEALIGSLNLGEMWSGRLRRLYWRHTLSEDMVLSLLQKSSITMPDEAALGGSLEREDARVIIAEVMAIAGVSGAGGREADEIAARYAQKAREAEGERPSLEVGELIDKFLSIEANAKDAPGQLRDFARRAGLDLNSSIGGFEKRLEIAENLAINLDDAVFSTTVGRRIEYYTGFVFEAHDQITQAVGPLASGGRYDNFLSDIGDSNTLSAVGCSIYIDRLVFLSGEHK